jgi:exodeoxyribonuclease V alpha subunit
MTTIFLAPPPAAHAAMLADLQRWVERGWLRALDHAFAAFVSHHAPQADALLVLGAALASHQLGRGHACLDLRAVVEHADRTLSLPPDGARGRPDEDDGLPPPVSPARLLAGVDLARWQAALDLPAVVGEGPGTQPLVRVADRLYLRRYWQYEQSVRAGIAQRLAQPTAAAAPAAQGALRHALDLLVPPSADSATNWQKVACALAARQGFAIVTGGPGTGKTTTVVRLLAALQHLAMTGATGGAADGAIGRPLRVRLAAPTGKAAARLSESIAGAVSRLPLAALGDEAALREAIPTEVTTVHRLLGSRPGTRHFRHDARNPLALDVLVLDEASMLDLEMTAQVLAALPQGARLVLLGDKDQLASVEAGAVLGELCQRADAGHYRPDTVAWLQAVSGETVPDALTDAQGHDLDQAIVKLRVSHRFSADSGIGQLAEAVNAGDARAVRRTLAAGHPDLAQATIDNADALRQLVLEGGGARFPAGAAAVRGLAPPVGYRHYLRVMRAQRPAGGAPRDALDAWALEVLAAYGQFQLLCALRDGPQGVTGLNQRVAALLRHEGELEAPDAGGWYAGRPVLVTRNDYGLGLMNGDVGVALPVPAPSEPPDGRAPVRQTLRVAFASGDGQGGIRWVLPSRLQAVETVFAMTVHKSQGSEFAHAALMLPDRAAAVLTRELVYTGITRARHWFTLAQARGGAGVLEAAVTTRVERVGGLAGAG